jgi:hypothetical protein
MVLLGKGWPMFFTVSRPDNQEVNLTHVSDAVVFGSGAAGGMVAHVLPPIRCPGARQAPSPPHFFTRKECTLVDAWTEMLIPRDDHSPGAHAAKIAEYLDQHLATAWEAALRRRWRQGLRLRDTLSRERHGQPLLPAAPAQRRAVLECMAQNNTTPQKPAAHVFVDLKAHTVRSDDTSQIGIHMELGYTDTTFLGAFVDEDLP